MENTYEFEGNKYTAEAVDLAAQRMESIYQQVMDNYKVVSGSTFSTQVTARDRDFV